MKLSLFKRAIGVGAGVTSVALMMATTPAHAAGTAPVPHVIAIGGSETTMLADNALATSWNASAAGAYSVQNINVLPTTTCADGTAKCVDVLAGSADPAAVVDAKFMQPTVSGANTYKAPNGSSDGVNSVASSGSTFGAMPQGTIDIGRSSRDYLADGVNSGAGDPNNMEFWAYAKDGVTWASKSLQAPSSMQPDVLRRIYLGLITDWSSVAGGGSGPISRFVAQPNSGTEVTYETKVLGFSPTSVPGLSAPTAVEENRGTAIPNSDREKAVYPYSLGKWAFQARPENKKNPTIDVRDGTRVGGFCTPASSAGSKVSAACADQANPATGVRGGTPNVQVGLTYTAVADIYILDANVITDVNAAPGATLDQGIAARFLYHVMDKDLKTTDLDSYNIARGLVGTGGALAAGTLNSTITGQGFLTLPVASIGDPDNGAATGRVRYIGCKVSSVPGTPPPAC